MCNDPEILGVNWLFTRVNPVVGAIAVKVKYPANCFSVFIGHAMGVDEENDIAHIKKNGQRTSAKIAKAIFPEFEDMRYHD